MVNDSVREELAMKVSPMTKTQIAKIEAEKAEIISRAEKAKAEIWKNSLPPSIRNEAPIKFEKPTPAAAPAMVSHPIQTPPVLPTKSAEITAAENKPTVQQPIATFAPPVPAPKEAPPASAAPLLSISTTKPHTTEFVSKPTSPTLVEFQNKNAVLPEWRLQLQNSVRRRTGGSNAQTEAAPISAAAPPQPRQTVLVTNGATAMKAEPVEQTAPPVASKNPTLEKALRRIEESRQKYSSEEAAAAAEPVQSPQPRTFPYAVPNRPHDFTVKQTAAAPSASAPGYITKPKPAPLVVAPLTEVKAEKFDTNKLPPIPAKISSSFEKRPLTVSADEFEEKDAAAFQMKAVEEPDVVAYQELAIEELEEDSDDRAPISLRFNAALFDLIIGSFLSVVLLAPFMLASGNLFTLQGLFAFLATCSIVMFIYLTTTIGTMGRTFGMRLFSLELIDIEQNAYPTFHQAAVNSSVYLVSLALGGLGFLTLFLNHEKRAAHDLLSGTIVVKEYE